MATTALMPIHARRKSADSVIKDTIHYVENPEKTEEGQFVSSYACNSYLADAEFMLLKREYINRTGRIRGKDDVIAYHLRQSFAPGEITPEEANRIGFETAKRFTHGNNAFIVATHTDRRHIHNHIIFSAVTLDCDRKFRNFWGSTKALRRLNDLICLEHGLSIVQFPKPHGKSYRNWLGDKAPTQRDELRASIDSALSRNPAGFEALLQFLQADGWEIKRGKHIAFRKAGQQRFMRLDSLGDGYSAADLADVLNGRRRHHPRGINDRLQRPIDIEQITTAGKGAGYARWAGKFNTKQAAKALLRFSELGFQSYDDLAQRAAEASRRCDELGQQLRDLETQIADNTVLKKHILNYIKTKDTFAAYRASGYSPQFKAEHTEELMLRQAAKEAFDALGSRRIPTIRELDQETSQLIIWKKALYAEYAKVKKEMRELNTIKANVTYQLCSAKQREHNSNTKPLWSL